MDKRILFDNNDLELINKHKWIVDKRGYAVSIMTWNITMHRLLMNPPKGMDVDHINGNRLDNRRENLRIVTRQQNIINSKSAKHSSFYKGVSWCPPLKKWVTRIRKNGKSNYIGSFKSELHAAMAYDMWAKEMHGKYAHLNFKSVLP